MSLSKLIFGATLVLISCKTQQVNLKFSADQLTKQIGTKLGEKYQTKNNNADTYVLGWREDNSSGTLVIRYGVWDITSGALIYANTALRGSVQWLDNTSLLVEEYPGIIDGENQNFKFKIDLNTKVKTPLYEKKDI
jgi:hypothetical protein